MKAQHDSKIAVDEIDVSCDRSYEQLESGTYPGRSPQDSKGTIRDRCSISSLNASSHYVYYAHFVEKLV